MEWESIYDFVKWVMLREQLGAEYFDAYRYIKDATDNFENYNVGKFRAAFCDAVEQFKDHVERWFYQNPLEADYMPNDLCNGCYNEVMELLDRKLNGINESVIKQPQPEVQITTQQKELHYYCQKAIDKGYLVKVDGGYKRVRWSKAQLAYFLGHFKKIDGTFPDIEYCNMFGESRLSKALGQLINNKTGYGKPKGYDIVDNILQE